MTRRLVLASLLVALILSSGVQSAYGWANGGNRGNGVGTHDWVLGRALVLAGSEGRWVDRVTAYRATDDPDSYKTSPYYHHFRESGIVRGGPYVVSYYYGKAVAAYQAGDYEAASKYVGVMSHYYADITEPFHTTRAAAKYRKLHVEYEYDVDKYHRSTGNAASWITPREPRQVTDVRKKAIAAARFARSRYPSLYKAYRVSHKVSRGTPNRVTKEVLSRCANDLADLIRTIPTGGGLAPLPEQPDVRLTLSYPRQSQNVGAFVTCTDAEGKPMPGVGVKFIWQLPTGTKTYLLYTENDGKVRQYKNIGKSPLMKAKYVTAYVPGSGEAVSASDWYKPTKVLASGSGGFKAWVSNTRPKAGTDITAYALARDTSGNPVAGLDVTFTWSLDGYKAKYTTTTDSKGVARCTRNVGEPASGVRAYFRADTQAGGYNRASAPSLIPY